MNVHCTRIHNPETWNHLKQIITDVNYTTYNIFEFTMFLNILLYFNIQTGRVCIAAKQSVTKIFKINIWTPFIKWTEKKNADVVVIEREVSNFHHGKEM